MLLQKDISRSWLLDGVARTFAAAGIAPTASLAVAESLVDADARGTHSHGVMLVPMYLDRIEAGSVSVASSAEVVLDAGVVGVLDAHDCLGQLSGDQAMGLAIEKAGSLGVGIVTVRHAFHFGGAFRYARAAARQGHIGIAMSNTRPLMPAPGGAQAVVGNNPLAIAVPDPDGGNPTILDMALSEVALGKIRLAARAGEDIPSTWATDKEGAPTSDPNQALEGMLLPSGMHKGYGLALMVDVLTGVLSGGSSGSLVQGLYADTSRPNDCAHTFVAIDPGAFGSAEDFRANLARLEAEILDSPTAPGVERVYLPGEIESSREAGSASRGIALDPQVLTSLRKAAEKLGVDLGSAPDGEGNFDE
jgi:LDH2 family malate/lactate/ureidoglycolate dehydrogenase